MKARTKARTRLAIVVTRASGAVDDYGIVFDSRWGPLRRWFAKRRIERLNRQHEVRDKEQ